MVFTSRKPLCQAYSKSWIEAGNISMPQLQQLNVEKNCIFSARFFAPSFSCTDTNISSTEKPDCGLSLCVDNQGFSEFTFSVKQQVYSHTDTCFSIVVPFKAESVCSLPVLLDGSGVIGSICAEKAREFRVSIAVMARPVYLKRKAYWSVPECWIAHAEAVKAMRFLRL